MTAFLAAGCKTTSTVTPGDEVASSVRGYRACTVKTMAEYLKSSGKDDANQAVHRNCDMHLDSFGGALRPAGASSTQVADYKRGLLTAS